MDNPSGVWPNVSRFAYGLLGRRTSLTTPDAGTSSSYRPVSRVTGTDTLLASFTYDRDGQLGLPATSTTGEGFTASVEDYDARNRPLHRTLTSPATQVVKESRSAADAEAFGLLECAAGSPYTAEPVPTEVEVSSDWMSYMSTVASDPAPESV